MSNDIALFDQGLPSYLKNVGLDADTLAVAGGNGGGSGKRISIKGGVFRMYVGGKEVAINEERSMRVVFVRMAPHTSRTYYEGSYEEGKKVSPVCWSSDAKVPDADVATPFAPKCADCPNSVKEGNRGAPCRFSHRVAVVLADDLDGDIYQLVLPATSVFGDGEQGKWPFKAYIRYLAANSVPAGAVVTEMRFDPSSPTPKLTFKPAGFIDAANYEKLRLKGEEKEAVRAITLTVAKLDGVKQLAAPAAPAAEAKVATVEVETAPTEEVKKRPSKAETAAASVKEKNVADIVGDWLRDDEE